MGDNKDTITSTVKTILKVPSEEEQSETQLLTSFWYNEQYSDERRFHDCVNADQFPKLLSALLNHRLCVSEWTSQSCDADHLLTVLRSVRILSRDTLLRQCYLGNQHVLSSIITLFRQMINDDYNDSIVELANIIQKLSGTDSLKDILVQHGLHHDASKLLSTSNLSLLQPCLCLLINLAKSDSCRAAVVTTNCMEKLMNILADYDVSCQRLAIDLMSVLVKERECRDHLITLNCLAVFLSILHCKDLHLLFRVVTILERLVEEGDQFRQLGGIPIILNLLREEGLVDVATEQITGAVTSSMEQKDKKLLLLCGCCSLLTQLILSDVSANTLVQCNGVYIIAVHVMPTSPSHHVMLQKHACRALRYLYSIERNRKQFKKIFPAKVLEAFIDIGHYVKELSSYSNLVQLINSQSEAEQEMMIENIKALDRSSESLTNIGGYSVVEYLGQGAFGVVYKVKRPDSDYYYAMKEIKSSHSLLGNNNEQRERSLGKLFNEVTIIKEQLQHPNIISYYKVFREGDSLYIIMEYIEGSSLLQLCNSLKEKKKSFSEERIWKIFTQLVLALRYIHKDRHIIHRDLTASNVMVTNEDHVMLMDFGLAKQKQRELSMMQSVVGTMVYWCPELVQSQPYTEKADVWAAGCLLYQMAMLSYPFHSPNLLKLAQQIVECNYQPLPPNKYSDRLSAVIAKCLTVNCNDRPDIVEVASCITDIIMKQMDHVMQLQMTLSKKLEREKQRAIKSRRHSNSSWLQDAPVNCWTEQTAPLDGSSDSVFLPQPSRGRGSASIALSSHSTPIIASLSPSEKARRSQRVSISPDRLRQINDPITNLLGQLHKLIYITQLAPSSTLSSRRALIKLYVKKLFSNRHDHVILKYELHKLSTGSEQVIELLTQPAEVLLVKKALTEYTSGCPGNLTDDVVTYQQLQNMIDNLLEENYEQ